MGRARKLNAPLATLGLLILSAGCNGDPGDRIAEPTSQSTSTAAPQSSVATTPTTQDPAGEIVGRYKQFWEVRFEANRPPVNPDDPRLSQYATDQQFDTVVTETRQRSDQGLAIRRPEPSVYERRVKVVSIVADAATLQDCVTNDGIVYRVATGQVVDDSVVTRSLMATMRRVDGAWKLAETKVIQEWKGVAGCAQSPDFA